MAATAQGLLLSLCFLTRYDNAPRFVLLPTRRRFASLSMGCGHGKRTSAVGCRDQHPSRTASNAQRPTPQDVSRNGPSQAAKQPIPHCDSAFFGLRNRPDCKADDNQVVRRTIKSSQPTAPKLFLEAWLQHLKTKGSPAADCLLNININASLLRRAKRFQYSSSLNKKSSFVG